MQLRSLLSGNDAITLLEIIHRSLSCIAKNDFVALFPKMQELFSFDYACSILGYRENDHVSVFDSINISYPEEFLKAYKSRNFIQIDPVVKNYFADYKLQHWSFEKRRLSQAAELISFSIDFGLTSGYAQGSKPFGPEKNASLFSFASASMKSDTRTDVILALVIPHLHLALSQVCRKKQSLSDGIVLSRREKEVLDWVKQGKSSWDISVILQISESTVNFHVYNIMQKLGTINRPQSVAVAAHLGLIDFN
jgi:LuxR family transcriptional regulator, quorum-sensing system regulator CviR